MDAAAQRAVMGTAHHLNEATEQVARAVRRDRSRRVSLGADIASSAVLLGIVVGFTVLLVLPIALILGLVL
jgi:ABC-type transporter Mla subunit MlaD